jgi:hypothetical protein
MTITRVSSGPGNSHLLHSLRGAGLNVFYTAVPILMACPADDSLVIAERRRKVRDPSSRVAQLEAKVRGATSTAACSGHGTHACQQAGLPAPHPTVAMLQVLVLLQEKAQLNAQHAQMMHSKEAEMRRLQQHISTELQQLKQRQIEASHKPQATNDAPPASALRCSDEALILHVL